MVPPVPSRPGFTKSVDAREHLPDQRVTYTFEIGNPTVATFAGFSLDDTLSYDGRWVADSLAVDPSCTGTFTGFDHSAGRHPHPQQQQPDAANLKYDAAACILILSVDASAD